MLRAAINLSCFTRMSLSECTKSIKITCSPNNFYNNCSLQVKVEGWVLRGERNVWERSGSNLKCTKYYISHVAEI